jgi:hypothetical protein
MHIENMKLKGELRIQMFDKDGNSTLDKVVPNLVVNAGLALVTSRLVGTADAVVTHMAVGSSSTAPAAAQTDLSSILGTRIALDSTTRVLTTVANDSVQYVATFGAGVSTGTIAEAGLFNASTSGSMLCRTLTGTITKGASDSLVITWKVVFA